MTLGCPPPPPFFSPFSFLNKDSSLWEGLSFFSRWNITHHAISVYFLRYKRGLVFTKDKQGDRWGS